MRSIFLAPGASVFALLISAPVLSAPASAAEIAVASKIDTVTVFPDAAIISRIADVDLPQGDSVLLFGGDYMASTWQSDGSRWDALDPSAARSGRNLAGLAWVR